MNLGCSKELNELELLKPQILCYDQNLLAMQIRTQDLNTFSDDKYTEVCIEQAQKVVCVADDIPRLINADEVLAYRLGINSLDDDQ
jgi:hypothetical protein